MRRCLSNHGVLDFPPCPTATRRPSNSSAARRDHSKSMFEPSIILQHHAELVRLSPLICMIAIISLRFFQQDGATPRRRC